jgi:hypothetical protein
MKSHRLIYSLWMLISVVIIQQGYAQESHLQVVETLYGRLALQVPKASSLTIERVPQTSFAVDTDTSAAALQVDFPEISYLKVGTKRYARSIRLHYQLSDSSGIRGSTFTSVDTASLKQIRSLRREAPPSLRGGPVSNTDKWLRPLAIVGGSIGAVLVLFRLRTR